MFPKGVLSPGNSDKTKFVMVRIPRTQPPTQATLADLFSSQPFQPMEIKNGDKKTFWSLGIPELQLAVDPLGGS